MPDVHLIGVCSEIFMRPGVLQLIYTSLEYPSDYRTGYPGQAWLPTGGTDLDYSKIANCSSAEDMAAHHDIVSLVWFDNTVTRYLYTFHIWKDDNFNGQVFVNATGLWDPTAFMEGSSSDPTTVYLTVYCPNPQFSPTDPAGSLIGPSIRVDPWPPGEDWRLFTCPQKPGLGSWGRTSGLSNSAREPR